MTITTKAMENYRYKLETYNPETGKHICPSCGHKSFVYYVDTYQEDRPIYPTVGRCERINECNYNLTPWQFFKDENINIDEQLSSSGLNIHEAQSQTPKKYNCIMPEHLQKSMLNPANSFTLFLLRYLNNDFKRLKRLINMYYVGSYGDGVIYWQVDHNHKIRTGKIMYYKPDGHRCDCLNWYHKKYNNFNLKQCLYGEHLLNDSTKTVFIVESEKTAIILKNHFINDADIVVMATGGIHNLTPDRFTVFNPDVKLICLPDIGAEDLWQNKIERIKDSLSIDISLYNSNRFIKTVLHSNYALSRGQDVADSFIYKQEHREEIEAKFLKSLAEWKAKNSTV